MHVLTLSISGSRGGCVRLPCASGAPEPAAHAQRGANARRVARRLTLLLALVVAAAACDDTQPDTSNADTSTADASNPDTLGVDTQTDAGAQADTTGPDTGPADVSGDDCSKPSDCKGALKTCQQWTCNLGACVAVGAPDGAICQDGDACNPGLCNTGVCKSKPVSCPTASAPCRVNACHPATGKCSETDAADGAACDDGQACSQDDTCLAGVCQAGKGACECKSDADCPDDKDLCNGVPYCDTQAGKCATNAATTVTCPTGKDTACAKNTCTPATGACAMAPQPDKTPCDDGDVCTSGDACAKGACVAGEDTCGCKKDADCTDDGDACNGTPFCNLASGKCQNNPATVVVCPSAADTACVANLCEPKTGACSLTPTNDGKACDDDNPCTPDETCSKGVCDSKTNKCACAVDADCAKQDDGDLCNGTLYCDQVTKNCKPNPATKVTCQTVDNTACSVAKCAPKTGQCSLQPLKDTTPCDDGNACTTGDACAKGVCTPAATAPECVCTADADCAKFEDGDLCNGTLVCDKAKKQCIVDPKTTVFCPSGNNTQCAHNVCDAKTGKCAMTPANVNSACDDKQPCTVVDRCGADGTCKPGNDVCECGPHKPKVDCDATKGDGDVCNGTLWCDTTALPFKCAPKPKSAVTCKTVDDTFCQANTCDKKTGVCSLQPVAANVAKPCDDANPCSVATVCQGGVCKGGTSKDCDDKNPCTQDACAKASDCTHAPLTGAACDDGKPCTGPDSCNKGVCGGNPKSCDDNNPCTIDACDDTQPGGCMHPPTTAPCSDGDACTSGDSCKAGKCVGGAAKSCDDGNSCTADTCDTKTAACSNKGSSGGSCSLIGSVAGTCDVGVCKAKAPCDLVTRELPYGGAANSASEHVVSLAAGGHAVAGRERSQGGKWVPLVARLDDNGAPLWTWRETGAQNDEAVAHAVLDVGDGGPLDDGTSSVLAVGVSNLANTPLGAVWRLSAAGKLIDKTTFGGAGADRLRDVRRFGDGLVLTGDTSTQSNGKTDCWVLRTTGAKPKVVWDVRFGGSGAESCYAVRTQGTSVLAVGATEGVGTSTDAYAVLVDSAGKLQWKKAYGGKGTQRFYAAAALGDGRWLAGGTSKDGTEAGYLTRLSASGAQEATVYPKELREFSGLHVHANGSVSALGQTVPLITGGSFDLTVRATVLARLSSSLKVTWSQGLPATAAVDVHAKLQLDGDRLLFAGSRHTDIESDGKKELQALALATDAWGHATCASAGLCAHPAYRFCDDGEPCTTDTCVPASGCKHAPVAGCATAAASLDLDHDGLAGSADPCPSVWNPDGDKTACAPAGTLLNGAVNVTLSEPGAAPGYSGRRRTNEVVEVALANGLAHDSALEAWWRFDGNTLDSSGKKRHLDKAGGTYAPSGLSSQSHAFRVRGPKNSTSGFDDLVTTDLTVALWARAVRDDDGASCTFVQASGAAAALKTEGHLQLKVDDDGALRMSYGTHDGSFAGPGVAGLRSEDAQVTQLDQWHHYALVSRMGQPVVAYVDGVSVPLKSDGGDPLSADFPVGLEYFKVGDDSGGTGDCAVTVDDLLLFSRPLSEPEIQALAQSRAPYRTLLKAPKSPTFGGLKMTERTPWDSAPHLTHSEVVGKRPLGPDDLTDALGYWRFDGKPTNEIQGKSDAKPVAVDWVDGGFAVADKAARFNGKTSYMTVTQAESTVTDFTVEAWFRVEAPSPPRMYLVDTRATQSSAKSGVALLLDTQPGTRNYRLGHMVSHGGTNYQGYYTTTLDTGWHHTALRRQSGKLTMFLDGVALNATWAKGDTVTSALKLFGSKPARFGYYGAGTLGADFKTYGLFGALDEVAIHATAVSDDALARRVAGPPRIRFLASTGASVASEGYLYHQYALVEDGAKHTPPTLLALDKKTTCSGLLSPCFGIVGWWRFDGFGALALDATTGRRVGTLKAGAVQTGAAALFPTAEAHVDLGLWKAPFIGGDFTVEWLGALTSTSANAAAVLLRREGHAPGLRIQSGKFALDAAPNATVSGGAPKARVSQALAAVYDASAKLARLLLDGAKVGESTVTPAGNTLPLRLLLGKGAGTAGHIGRASSLRIFSRPLATDELHHHPATTWAPAKK